jgi:hypothetical protein
MEVILPYVAWITLIAYLIDASLRDGDANVPLGLSQGAGCERLGEFYLEPPLRGGACPDLGVGNAQRFRGGVAAKPSRNRRCAGDFDLPKGRFNEPLRP